MYYIWECRFLFKAVTSSEYAPRVRLLRHIEFLCNFLRNLPTIFHSGLTSLFSLYQYSTWGCFLHSNQLLYFLRPSMMPANQQMWGDISETVLFACIHSTYEPLLMSLLITYLFAFGGKQSILVFSPLLNWILSLSAFAFLWVSCMIHRLTNLLSGIKLANILVLVLKFDFIILSVHLAF